MQEDFISSQMKRCNRNLFLISAVSMFVVIIVAAFSYNYFFNLLSSPAEINVTSLTSLNTLEAHNKDFVTVTGDDAFFSGVQYIEATYEKGTYKQVDSKVISDYVYLIVDYNLLVVQTAPGNIKLSYKGTLQEIPKDLKEELFHVAVLDSISEDPEELTAEEFDLIVFPFMLDAQADIIGGYIGLTILVLLALVSLWNLFRYGQRLVDPFGHPIYKSLRVYGNPEAVAKDIDEDLASTGIPIGKKIIVSYEWLVKEKPFGLTLVPLQDVLWMYKHITKHRINFIIPAGKTYSLVIFRKNRKKLDINMRGKDVDAVVEVVHSKAPGILQGHSDYLLQLWRSNYTAFLAEIKSLNNAI